MRLATVRVWDSKKRRVRVFDARHYHLSGLLLDPRFRIVSETRGEAADAEITREIAQHAAEAARAAVPTHPAHQDAARAYAARQPEAEIAAAPAAPEGRDEPEGLAGWRALPWFSARRRIKEATGVLPDSKRHAEQIVAAFLRGDIPAGEGP